MSNSRAEAAFRRSQYQHGATVSGLCGDIKAQSGHAALCDLIRSFRMAETTPDDYWLTGSALYLPLLDLMGHTTQGAAKDWDVLYSSFRNSTNPANARPNSWTLSRNRFNGDKLVSACGVEVDMINGAFLAGVDPTRALHPVVDYLERAPISTWAVVSEINSAAIVMLPTFTEALSRKSIDVHNVESFLYFMGENPDMFREKIVSVSAKTNLEPDGEVLALLDLTRAQFDQQKEEISTT